MSRARDLAAFVSNADGDIKFDTDTLFIDSSANKVGIRTDSPDTELHIAGGANPTLQLTAYEGTQDCDVQILPVRAELSGSESIMAFKTNDGTSLNEVMRLDEDGNVGIGTSSPNSYTGYTALTLNNATSGGLIDIERNGTLIGEIFTDDANTFALQAVGSRSIAFRTNSSERMRILSSGGITFNGDTAAANALDDYEEGSFTPTVSSASWVGTYHSTNNGRYTKIGRLVTFSFNLDLTSSSTLPTGEVVFGGLPYASATASGALAAPRFPFHSYNVNYDSNSSVHMMGYIPTGGSTQIKVLATRDNSTWVTVNHGTSSNQLQFGSGRVLMIFNGFYHTDT